MAKITISDIQSGYASTSALNATFNTLEDHFNNKVLYRNNPSGEPNQMQQDLDMNNFGLLNVNGLTTTSFTVNGVDYLAAMNTIYNNYTSITQSVTVSTASPTGGSDGDIWFKIT